MPLHKSVLLEEALDYLAPKKGHTIVDGTLGAGGHAKALLQKIGADGLLIGWDKDEQALDAARQALKEHENHFMTIHDDFKNIPDRLKELKRLPVDGVLLDLGVSSMQLDRPERGFSFQQDGPLDMRMDVRQGETAYRLVHQTPLKALETILLKWGEERYFRRIAKAIVNRRARRPIQSTRELADVVRSAVPPKARHGRLHPATRSFQAIRIAVNAEEDSLTTFLNRAPECLKPGGRLVIISFHSLEDRAVKNAFRGYAKRGEGALLTKKPVRPGPSEAQANPRSRSAKLRAFEKGPGRRDA